MRARQGWLRVALAISFGLAALGLAPGVAGAQPSAPAGPAGAASGAGAAAEAQALERRLRDLNDAGRFSEALPVAEQLAALRAGSLGPEHPDAVAALQLLAWAHRRVGDLRRAEPLFQRVLEIRERALPAAHRDLAQARENLAALYREAQDHERAEPLLRQLVAGARGTDRLPQALTVLAGVLAERGDLDEAVATYEEAIAALEALPSPIVRDTDHVDGAGGGATAAAVNDPARSDVAIARDNLALALAARGDLDRAAALAARALTELERSLGPEDRAVAVCLNNLGRIHHRRGALDEAERHLRRSAAMREKVFAADHPRVAVPLHNLAGVLWDRGRFSEAEALFRRALGILERAHGPGHPRAADVLNGLAGVALAQGRVDEAVALRRRAAELQEAQLDLLLLSGSERQKQALVEAIGPVTDSIVSLHATSAPGHAEAARLALGTALRRKGIVLEVTARGLDLLRRSVARGDEPLLAELAAVASQRATLLSRGTGQQDPAAREELRRLAEAQRRLEGEISRRSAAFRAARAPVTVEAVQAALPEGSALLEIVAYQPFDPQRPQASRLGPLRYAAYVLRPGGPPAAAELGEAAVIDAAAAELRSALADPARDPRPAARALDALVMARITPHLGGARRLFVSPDGALGLVPLGALVDEEGRYRVERLSITLLDSGRDRVRSGAGAPVSGGAMIVGGPDFGPMPPRAPASTSASAPGPAPAKRPGATGAAALAKVRFPPLRGAAREAAELAALLPGARVLTGGAATEGALKAARGPRLLHVATHGFFLPGASRAEATLHRGLGDGGEPGPPPEESPLLRAGLALAGANLRESEAEDGILTALEAATLDLRGTELVVLSACETGVGEAKRGEGIYGLRRALAMAGAEAQLMSLWKVDDAATRALMVAYYQALAAGRGRGEALREVQLAMLADSKTAHPYYWAAFVLAGEPGPVAGLTPRAPGAVPRAPPSPRGCGCEAVGAPGDGWRAVGLGLGLATAQRRRRRPAMAQQIRPKRPRTIGGEQGGRELAAPPGVKSSARGRTKGARC